MSDLDYPKYQFSRMMGGDQIVVRSEHQEEMETMIKWVKTLGAVKEDALTQTSQNTCPLHKVPFTKTGTSAKGEWSMHKNDSGEACFGTGYKARK